MANYKNQHYVPRCHLRHFCSDNDGRVINIFNIDRALGIKDAPLKAQCSANYFYGPDLRLEKTLGSYEGLYGQVLSRVKTDGYFLTDGDKALFRQFCLLQHCRTDAASKRGALMMSELAEIAHGPEQPTSWRLTIREVTQMAMRAFVDLMHDADDLKVCLIRNDSKLQFVTSDNPSILTNRWYAQNSKTRGQSAGLSHAGALFFLPLSPRILCVLYDGDVYSLPHERGWLSAKKIADVEAFNEHQFLCCMSNVYFSNWASLGDIEQTHQKIVRIRPTIRHKINVAVFDHENEQGETYKVIQREQLERKGKAFLHLQTITPRPNRWPSIIQMRSDARIYSNGTGTGFVRRASAEKSGFSDRPYKRI